MEVALLPDGGVGIRDSKQAESPASRYIPEKLRHLSKECGPENSMPSSKDGSPPTSPDRPVDTDTSSVILSPACCQVSAATAERARHRPGAMRHGARQVAPAASSFPEYRADRPHHMSHIPEGGLVARTNLLHDLTPPTGGSASRLSESLGLDSLCPNRAKYQTPLRDQWSRTPWLWTRTATPPLHG